MVQYVGEVSNAGRIRHEELEQSLELMGDIHQLNDFLKGGDFNRSKQTQLSATMHQLELDPAIEGQLTLDTFQVCPIIFLPAPAHCFLQGKFDVKDFVGSVSERLITLSKTSSGRASDPFESLPPCDVSLPQHLTRNPSSAHSKQPLTV